MPKNINEALAKVTNIETVDFRLALSDGKFSPAVSLVNADIADASGVVLYSFDLKSGRVKSTRINLELKHTPSPLKLAEAFKRVWYVYEAAKLERDYSAYTDVANVMDALKPALEAVQGRMHSVKCLERFTPATVEAVPDFVKVWVKAARGEKADSYPDSVQGAFKALSAAVKAVKVTDGVVESYKDIRTALTSLSPLLFGGYSVDGETVTEEWHYNANHNLTVDVFRVAYAGRRIGNDGLVCRRFANDSVVMAEVVLACIEHLQAKESENKPEAKKAAK